MSGDGRRPVVGDLCEQVIDLVGRRAEAEVMATAGRAALTRFANSFIHQNVASDDVVIRLRLVAGGRLASATTERTDGEGLVRLVERTLEAARHRPGDPGWPGPAPPVPIPDAGAGDGRYDPETHRARPDDRAAVVAAFVGAGPGLAAAGFCDSVGYGSAFGNSAGHRAHGLVSRATVDAIHRTTASDGAGWQTATHLSDLDGARAGRVAAGKARAGAEPRDLGPGRYEVVLEPSCVADMVQFLLDGYSARTHLEGRSFVRLGESQFDPAISLHDDVADPGTFGLAFDAEGTPKRAVALVTDGVSSTLLHDRRTALEAGTESTGHGVAGGESFGPMASNAVVRPGLRPPEDMIASVERGLLVTDFWYTRILDPKTQVVTGLTRNGTFLIERGEVTGAVRNLRFTQSYVDALAPGQVLGVGNDLSLRPSGHLVPSLHLASWNVTG